MAISCYSLQPNGTCSQSCRRSGQRHSYPQPSLHWPQRLSYLSRPHKGLSYTKRVMYLVAERSRPRMLCCFRRTFWKKINRINQSLAHLNTTITVFSLSVMGGFRSGLRGSNRPRGYKLEFLLKLKINRP